jgi:hypothetical protein
LCNRTVSSWLTGRIPGEVEDRRVASVAPSLAMGW